MNNKEITEAVQMISGLTNLLERVRMDVMDDCVPCMRFRMEKVIREVKLLNNHISRQTVYEVKETEE